MVEIDELVVADDPSAWRAAGFTVGDDDRCTIGTVQVHLAGPDAGKRIVGWRLRGADGIADLDGLPVLPGPAPAGTAATAVHPNGVVSIDHVVVLSPDLERTTAAFASIGLDARRVRDVDAEQYGFPARQVFFRMGDVVIEVIGPAEPAADASADRPAAFYGLAYTVADIDATAAQLGEHLGRVKDAVQPGRRIATLRHKEVGVSVATAFMSPGPAVIC